MKSVRTFTGHRWYQPLRARSNTNVRVCFKLCTSSCNLSAEYFQSWNDEDQDDASTTIILMVNHDLSLLSGRFGFTFARGGGIGETGLNKTDTEVSQ